MDNMKYTTVSISKELMNIIKEYMNLHGGEYTSIAEFIRAAIREKIKCDK
jgi:Arc/MetJ-type ribon-helix-helix transcriptional regulator